MSTQHTLIIRNVEVEGHAGLDVRIDGCSISEVGVRLRGGEELDGQGGALIPGLADHHIHLMALAAQMESIDLGGVTSRAELAATIADVVANRAPGTWLRVFGYHEIMAGELTSRELDLLAPRHCLRIQHQTGALWMLNSAALDRVGAARDPAPCIERDANGLPTGRIWRGDVWLREKIGSQLPRLDAVGTRLASLGITAVTDASVTTDRAVAERIADAVRGGDLQQRVMLMSGGSLLPPADGVFAVGPVKILLDDYALPDLEWFVAKIAEARTWRRTVAVHCVTRTELALSLAAFDGAGVRPGDRIEHGGLIDQDSIGELHRLGLTVVTQPGFIQARGDRYLSEIGPEDRDDLYRCGSLLSEGVSVAAGSDAPYISPDPWMSIRTATERRSSAGYVIGESERVSAARALELYLGDLAAPGGAARRVRVGARADLCLLQAPLPETLGAAGTDYVRATLVAGRLIYESP